MKELGLRSKLSKKFKVTTNSKHNYLMVENVLDRNFIVSQPSKVCVSDIIYIQTKEGFLYLTTVVIDLYDRKMIGWSLSNGMSTEETSLAAWEMAVKNRKIVDGLIFHSDRGVQYASKKFAKTIESYGVMRSMSRKGNCWDNAVAESFFKSLKTELIYDNKLITKEKMELEIFEYIEIWYNKERRHSTLNYQTIEEFKNQKKNTSKCSLTNTGIFICISKRKRVQKSRQLDHKVHFPVRKPRISFSTLNPFHKIKKSMIRLH